MFHIIYKITNLVNNKIYIGAHSTDNIDDGYMGSGHALNRAKKKYGLENFKKDILFVYTKSEEMYQKESEIVTESFCAMKDNYNVRVGGIGGWNHWNNGSAAYLESTRRGARAAAKKTNAWIAQQKAENTEWYQQWCIRQRARIINKNNNSWIHYTEEQQAERRKKISEFQRGSGNSQYGKYWISNPLTKEVKRINASNDIPHGWVRGKKGHIPRNCWVTNGIENRYIPLEKQKEFMDLGYILGRTPRKLLTNP